MEPIRIKSPDSDFTFTIAEGRLRGIGKVYFEGRQDFSFSLSEIRPEPNILERRHPLFRQGLNVITLAIIAAGFFRLLEESDARTYILFLMGVFVMTGSLLTITFIRTYRYLTFINTNGTGLFCVTQTPANTRAVERLISAIHSHCHADRRDGFFESNPRE